MRLSLTAIWKENKNKQGGTPILTEAKKWLDVFSGYNMRVLEGMTGMEWVPSDADNDDSIDVYYNCADTDYLCDVVCSCTCGLYARQGLLRVTVPSGHALIVYHSPCLKFYRVYEDSRHTFFGLKYKNVCFDPCDFSFVDSSTTNDDTKVCEIIGWILDEGEDEKRCFACMLEPKNPLTQYLRAIGIDEVGVW